MFSLPANDPRRFVALWREAELHVLQSCDKCLAMKEKLLKMWRSTFSLIVHAITRLSMLIVYVRRLGRQLVRRNRTFNRTDRIQHQTDDRPGNTSGFFHHPRGCLIHTKIMNNHTYECLNRRQVSGWRRSIRTDLNVECNVHEGVKVWPRNKRRSDLICTFM